jgi:hypothetical protein
MQSGRRHHDNPTIAELGRGPAQERLLESLSDRSQHFPGLWRLATVRHPSQGEPGHLHLARRVSRLAHGAETYSPVTCHHGVEQAVNVDKLNEAGISQLGE